MQIIYQFTLFTNSQENDLEKFGFSQKRFEKKNLFFAACENVFSIQYNRISTESLESEKAIKIKVSINKHSVGQDGWWHDG